MPGADSLPEQAVAPESARLPRGVEIRPTPIPKFDGENASWVQDAFAENLNLVSGGTVTTGDGQTIQTPGILGSAQDRIAARLEEINATGQALAGEKEQFGGKLKGLRGPRAVREAETEKRRVSSADNSVSADARDRVRRQQGKIRELCERQHIDKDLQVKYNHMIEVEKYLAASPESSDLSSIRAILDALNWTKREPTRARIEDILDGATTAARGYEEYKTLTIGQEEGDKKTKGLRDFEADLKAAEEHRKSNTANLQSSLDAVRAKAQEWEARNARFKREDTPEQRRLKQDHALGQAVAEFLGNSYVPDAERLTQVGKDLSAANDKLNQGQAALTGLANLVGSRIANWLLNIAAPRILQELNQKVAGLNYEQHLIVDPASRLSQTGAPQALIDMVRKVKAPGFDMAAVPPRERVLAETVTALLGKGVVTVEDSSQEESITVGEAPEIAGPEDGGAEPEQSPPPTADELADLAMEGKLTVDQLLHLPEDPEISGINYTFIDPDNFGTMEADLRASLSGAAEGNPGGITPADLPLIVIDALRRVAPYLGGYPPETVVSLNDFRTHLDRLPEPSDPENQTNLAAAKRLLAVAEAANKLRKG